MCKWFCPALISQVGVKIRFRGHSVVSGYAGIFFFFVRFSFLMGEGSATVYLCRCRDFFFVRFSFIMGDRFSTLYPSIACVK